LYHKTSQMSIALRTLSKNSQKFLGYQTTYQII